MEKFDLFYYYQSLGEGKNIDRTVFTFQKDSFAISFSIKENPAAPLTFILYADVYLKEEKESTLIAKISQTIGSQPSFHLCEPCPFTKEDLMTEICKDVLV